MLKIDIRTNIKTVYLTFSLQALLNFFPSLNNLYLFKRISISSFPDSMNSARCIGRCVKDCQFFSIKKCISVKDAAHRIIASGNSGRKVCALNANLHLMSLATLTSY